MPKNPFPGMNPFFERHWGEVQASLVVSARNQLNRQLVGTLRARAEPLNADDAAWANTLVTLAS